MMVQGRLVQAHFIEFDQVFAKEKQRSDTFLTDQYVHVNSHNMKPVFTFINPTIGHKNLMLVSDRVLV
jgi:hypothetical protein